MLEAKLDIHRPGEWAKRSLLALAILFFISVHDAGKSAHSEVVDLTQADSGTFELISQAEYDLFFDEGKAAPDTAWKKFTPVSNAPEVYLLSPEDLNVTLQPPLNLDVRFEAFTGTEVAPDTVKFKYRKIGNWWDITDRILEHAEILPEGVHVTGALLPDGKHKLLLELQDTMGRKNQFVYEFRIKKP